MSLRAIVHLLRITPKFDRALGGVIAVLRAARGSSYTHTHRRLGLQTDLKEAIGAVWTLMAEESLAEEPLQ